MGTKMKGILRAIKGFNLAVFRLFRPRLRRRVKGLKPAWFGESGVTFIEIVIMSLIMTIALVAITKAIQVASKGALAAKERARALALARDKLEEVKNMGYEQMKMRLSNYYYPDQPSPDNPLHQLSSVAPYPTTKPSASEDPWTPETILVGKIFYWRHVVIKFVEEDTATKQLRQRPEPSPPTVIGGTNAASNLAYIEVDVTWFSNRTAKMEQVRVSTLLANQSVHEFALGQISGTVLDDDSDDDLIDKSPAESGTPPPPTVITGTDDKPITWASLVVIARNTVTGDTFTTMTDSEGRYRLTSMPEGEYLVRISGAPAYLDSYYTGETSGPYSPNPDVEVMPVSITASDPNQRNVNIWTIKTMKGTIKGRFATEDVAPALHRIRITCNDGVSEAWEMAVDAAVCSTGCSFSIPNVAYPSSGVVTYQVRIADLETNQSSTAYICMDLWEYNPAATVFYLGMPVAPGPTPFCGSCDLFPDCTRTATPFNADNPIPFTQSSTNSVVRVKMQETDDTGALISLSQTWLGRVRVTYAPLSGMGSPFSVTLLVDSVDGATMFQLPGGPASKVEFQAYMGDELNTTTGYTVDTYFLPFDLDAPTYDLEPGGVFSANPVEENRHMFVVTRIAEVCGTVWEVPDSKGFAGAQVNIRNDSTKWSTVVTADGDGRFSAPEVPVDDMLYTVEPVVGVDFISDPVSITDLEVVDHGIVYRATKFGVALEFTLNAINGIIKGEVTLGVGGPVVDTGALVIASTYNSSGSEFVSSLPSTNLIGHYTYSTVTLTDGTYQLKAATGASFNYYIYCSAIVDGVMKFYKSSSAVTPIANSDLIHNIPLP